MKVLVIPEDPTHDQYILKPIVEGIFRDLGRSARIEVLFDPHLRGIDEALDRDVVASIVDENPMVDLFVLVVDRDCDRFHNTRRANERAAEHSKLVAAVAVEEVEVWMLALHRERLRTAWSAVRKECDSKDVYAEPFLKAQGWASGPGRGRKRAMRALATHSWQGLLKLCPEIAELRVRISDLVARAG